MLCFPCEHVVHKSNQQELVIKSSSLISAFEILSSFVIIMCSNIESGTKAYMSLYPEGSTDGGIRLGNIVPDFGEWIVRFCEGWPMVMACAPHLHHTMCSHAFLVFVIAEMDTTHGKFDSFHEWKKGKWAILFSHPADFTVSVALHSVFLCGLAASMVLIPYYVICQ